jgi:acyl transferase domain-containing protein
VGESYWYRSATSRSADTSFTTQLHPGDTHLHDHVLHGLPTLSAAAQLALVHAAARAELACEKVRLESVVWLHPLSLNEGSASVAVSFSPVSAGSAQRSFELLSDEGCHARGLASPVNAPAPAQPIELPSLSRTREAAEIYDALAEAGIQYGPTFRLLEKITHSDAEAVGHLHPSASLEGDWAIQPGVVDCAFQVSSVLLAA